MVSLFDMTSFNFVIVIMFDSSSFSGSVKINAPFFLLYTPGSSSREKGNLINIVWYKCFLDFYFYLPHE